MVFWSSPPPSPPPPLCVDSILHPHPSSTVFYDAKQFNQDPFCGPLWVDSTASKSQMFAGVKKGSIANTACCAVGKYWIQGTSKCTRCDIGKYNNEIGSIAEAACKDCASGKYNNEAGSTAESACKDCASGKYNNELGLSACKDCASGKYNNELGPVSYTHLRAHET